MYDATYTRHLKDGNIEYGLPEGVPAPAPPKTRKSDIVKPTTFLLADRLVDEVIVCYITCQILIFHLAKTLCNVSL